MPRETGAFCFFGKEVPKTPGGVSETLIFFPSKTKTTL